MNIKSEHWFEIAEAFGTPFAERTGRQLEITSLKYINGDRCRSGLCAALDYEDILEEIGTLMKCSGYWWPCNDEGDKDRSDFALLMWAMGEDEFERLVK